MRKLPEFRIYRNLHKGCFSIQKWSPESKGYRLHSHMKDLIAINAEFRISQAGRKKVLNTKQKNVHAFIYCTEFINITGAEFRKRGEEIYYNPYKTESFQIKNSGDPVYGASKIILTNNRCYLDGK
jgi:hypothetical protein